MSQLFEEAVQLTSISPEGQLRVMDGVLKILTNGYGILKYEAKEATVGPADLWVMKKTRMLYFLGLSVRFLNPDVDAILESDLPALERLAEGSG